MVTRRRAWSVAAVAVAVVIAMFVVPLLNAVPADANRAERPAASESSSAWAQVPAQRPDVAPEASAAATDEDTGPIMVREKPLIASIDVQPQVACRGQDILVTTEVTDAGRDAKVMVAGEPQNPGLIRYDRPGTHTLSVMVRDWHDGYERREINVEIEDCEPENQLILELDRLAHDGVVVRVADMPLDPATADIYWEFGDGTRGRGRVVEHSYRFRSQTAPTTTFLITATARDAHGDTAIGRYAFTLTNPLAVAGRTPFVSLPVRYDRFVKPAADVVTTSIEIENTLGEAVAWDRVEVRAFPCSGAEAEDRVVAIDSAVTAPTLASGERRTFDLKLAMDQFREPACRILARLEAELGRRSVTVPVVLEVGVPADAVAVTDPEQLQLLRRVRELVGPGEPITPDLIARLRAHGRL